MDNLTYYNIYISIVVDKNTDMGYSMSNGSNKKFGWFAIFVALWIGFAFGDDSDKHKSQVRRLNSEISDKDSEIKRLKDENQKLKVTCPEDTPVDKKDNLYSPFRVR